MKGLDCYTRFNFLFQAIEISNLKAIGIPNLF